MNHAKRTLQISYFLGQNQSAKLKFEQGHYYFLAGLCSFLVAGRIFQLVKVRSLLCAS